MEDDKWQLPKNPTVLDKVGNDPDRDTAHLY